MRIVDVKWQPYGIAHNLSGYNLLKQGRTWRAVYPESGFYIIREGLSGRYFSGWHFEEEKDMDHNHTAGRTYFGMTSTFEEMVERCEQDMIQYRLGLCTEEERRIAEEDYERNYGKKHNKG